MAVIHGAYSVEQSIVLVIVFCLIRCAAMDLADMDVALGKAVERALIKAELPITYACTVMGIQEAHFRAALKGEGYRRLALNHLIKLGPLFMVHLTSELMWLVAKQRATEIVETFSVRERV